MVSDMAIRLTELRSAKFCWRLPQRKKAQPDEKSGDVDVRDQAGLGRRQPALYTFAKNATVIVELAISYDATLPPLRYLKKRRRGRCSWRMPSNRLNIQSAHRG